MDIRQIRERIITVLKSAGRFLRDMISLPYAKLYIAAALVLTIVFTLLGFPFDVLIRSELHKLEQRGLRSMEVGDIDFNLIGDSYIDTLSLGMGPDSYIAMNDVRFNILINPLTTLIKKTLKGDIAIGDFRFSDKDSSFSCILSGKFKLVASQGANLPKEGFLDLKLQNAALNGLTIKGFTVPAVRFNSLDMAAKLDKGEMKIIKFDGLGPDLNGSVRGSIALTPYIRNSTLDLTVDIDAQSKLLQDYRILLGDMLNSGDSRLRFNITGTISTPSVALPGSEKSGNR